MARPRKTVPSKETLQIPVTAEPTRRLKSSDEVPSWQRDNEYILSGYRQATGRLRRALRA